MNQFKKFFLWIPLFFILFIQLFPVALILMTSFKSEHDLLRSGPLSFSKIDFSNYLRVIETDSFLNYLGTSLKIGLGSTALSVILGLLAAFGLSRINHRTGDHLKIGLICARLTPPVALAIPLFLLVKSLGLTDTDSGLILAHTTLNLPFAVWLMLPFFSQLPKSYDEAARIDGCSLFDTFWRIILPLSLPGILVTTLFCFLMSWNDFLFSLVLAGSKTKTAPLAINAYMTGFGPEWGPMTASSVLILIPVFILSLSLQKHLIGGLNAGGVKG